MVSKEEKYAFLKEVESLVWKPIKELGYQLDYVKNNESFQRACQENPEILSEFQQISDMLDELAFIWQYFSYSVYLSDDLSEADDGLITLLDNLEKLKKHWQQFLEKYSIGIIFV